LIDPRVRLDPPDEPAPARTPSSRSPVSERLRNPDAVLDTTDLAELGYSKRAIVAILRACGVEWWDDFERPLITVRDFLAARERFTYRGDRVRPTRGSQRVRG
jgi:hypothetical protein